MSKAVAKSVARLRTRLTYRDINRCEIYAHQLRIFAIENKEIQHNNPEKYMGILREIRLMELFLEAYNSIASAERDDFVIVGRKVMGGSLQSFYFSNSHVAVNVSGCSQTSVYRCCRLGCYTNSKWRFTKMEKAGDSRIIQSSMNVEEIKTETNE